MVGSSKIIVIEQQEEEIIKVEIQTAAFTSDDYFSYIGSVIHGGELPDGRQRIIKRLDDDDDDNNDGSSPG